MDHAEAPAARVITEDVECAQCGYNLRTLDEQGACPECGAGVGISLLKWQASAEYALDRADATWLTSLRDGLICALVALICQLVALWLAFRPLADSPGGLINVSLVAATWVLCAASAWKLASRDVRERGAQVIRRTLLYSGIAWLVFPFIQHLGLGRAEHRLLAILELIAFVSLVPATVAYHLRIAQIAHRARSWTLRIVAGMSAVLIVWVNVGSYLPRFYRLDPALEWLRSSTIAYGSVATALEAVDEIMRGSANPLPYLALVAESAAVIEIVWALEVITRAIAAQKSRANSSP